MLLIPAEINRLKNLGRAEGREEGRAEGREVGRAEGREVGRAEASARYAEAWQRFGFDVDGVRVLPDTPEVRTFLTEAPAGPKK